MSDVLLEKFPEALLALCLRYQVAPVSLDAERFIVASHDELTLQQEGALQFGSNRMIESIRWSSLKLEQALQSLSGSEPDKALQHVAEQHILQEERHHYIADENDDEPVVKFISHTLDIALQRRASDIHFEPYANHYRIRFRIDGVLQEVIAPPAILASRLAARLKILGQLNIAERRLPQDGQITIKNGQQDYAMRISTLPVIDGEKVVLRIMESGGQPLDINQLGMSETQQSLYLKALRSPQGLILVTGPTGSGKTISLYSGLKILNHTSHNICSIEDPVEMPIDGINQTQVNVKAGFIFSQALRAFLRQDPDIIMVGEIRDRETAEIAIEAAQTGHLVLSTLHTNSTIETLIRLEQMGIPAYLIVGALRLIIAQRLVRCLCPHCRTLDDEFVEIKLPYWQGTVRSWRAVGCELCLNGYYGRTGIYEMLEITPVIIQAIFNQLSVNELELQAIEQGMQPLFIAGIKLVEQGVTSLQEIYRTIGYGGLSEKNNNINEEGIIPL